MLLSEKLTIVIPCKNEENYIIDLLRSIEWQYLINGTKVFVADAGSTDSTVERVNEFAKDSNLRIEIIEGGLPGEGRNNGANLSTTPFVLFIDSDITLTHKKIIYDSFVKMIDNNLQLLTANIGCETNWVANSLFSVANIFQNLSVLWHPFSTGMYMMVNKKAFDNLGGFHDDIQFAEDYHLSRRFPRDKFGVVSHTINSTDRRFKRMGYFKCMWFAFAAWINSNNESRYRKDIGYWDHLKE